MILLVSCQDDSIVLSQEGVYEGIFYQTTPQQRNKSSQVTLELSGGKFAGLSSEDKYPAICTGTYTTKSKLIEFSNECVFTADFDWSLVLDGTYEVAIDPDMDSLFLIQEISEDRFNVFHLAKK
jgi:hypothetical protein